MRPGRDRNNFHWKLQKGTGPDDPPHFNLRKLRLSLGEPVKGINLCCFRITLCITKHRGSQELQSLRWNQIPGREQFGVDMVARLQGKDGKANLMH